MENDLVKKIEERISELESQGKKIVDFVNGITANVKKLLADKVRANDEANVIAGAIQAFKGVLVEISEKEKVSEKLEPLSTEKEENV
jgi:hypothetical protein